MKLLKKLKDLGVLLQVENGNLVLNAPTGVLTEQLIAEVKVNKTDLLDVLLGYIPIPRAIVQESYPLTSSQKRLWTLSQFDGGSRAYSIPAIFEMKGILDSVLLHKSFEAIFSRHESLRTYFKEEKSGSVCQFVQSYEDLDFKVEERDIRKVKDKKIVQEQLIIDFFGEPFDLTMAPLVKAMLVQNAVDSYLLLFSMHHIIGDGWSMEILIQEVMTTYNGLKLGRIEVLPELKIQFKDYVIWQSLRQENNLESQKHYWLQHFSGELPKLNLPTWKTRPKLRTHHGATIVFDFSKTLTNKLNRFAEERGMTLFMVLMASINSLFYKYTGDTDIIIGTPTADREHEDLKQQIGLYLNTLAIRTQFPEASTFEDLLRIQKDTLLSAYAHKDYPFEALTQELKIQMDTSRSALFDVMVVLQNQQILASSNAFQLNDIQIRPLDNYSYNTSQFDLTFSFLEKENSGTLQLSLEYNTDIFDKEYVEKIQDHLKHFMVHAMEEPDKFIYDIPYLSKEEENQLLFSFNATKKIYPKANSLMDLFCAQVDKSPQAIALCFEGKEITYTQLDTLSNQLANYLIHDFGIVTEDLVGICLDRTEWLIISILGVLKSGAAYVPIDPYYPEQRIAYMKSDSNCKVCIDKEFLFQYKSVQITDEKCNVSLSPNNLAYVMYTSGSTGKPKGVLVTHDNVMNLIDWYTDTYHITKNTRSIQLTNFSFDPSLEDIFGTLINGGTYYCISKEMLLDIDALRKFINEKRITILNYVPNFLHDLLFDTPRMMSLETIIAGGENLTEFVKDAIIHAGYTLYNNYGPTETTVDALSGKMAIERKVSLGKPIANTEIYILSKNLGLQAIGIIGELCISGKGVSRGYLNRKELTEEKFIEHPFKQGERLYRTGDLAKWLPNGEVLFLGRKDDQVKLRGHRIELGEIQKAILEFKGIVQVVLQITNAKKEALLIAYIVCEERLDRQELRIALGQKLPSYMVPNHFIEIQEIPLMPNGKTDNKGLRQILEADTMEKEYIGARNALEEELVEIWKEVLEVEVVGITDNFFEIGGTSISLIQLHRKIKQLLNNELEIVQLFSCPTISELVATGIFHTDEAPLEKKITQIEF